ncbi:MAG: tryptophan synthase subunit alpha [Firmicutes bacterium]|nr:tryptophan synthase subunit alpha [Bacillota bacterium]
MDRFEGLRTRKSLIGYLTLGYPDRTRFFQAVAAVGNAGIDALEVGLPSRDPYMDGKVIADSHAHALENGWTSEDLQDDLHKVREIMGNIPLLLMGYRQDIQAVIHGDLNAVDGIICPDGQELSLPESLASIQICDETMDDVLLKDKVSRASGFIYVLSARGKTGAKQEVPSAYVQTIQRLKNLTDLPMLVGFGVNSPDAARTVVNNNADGVIIGSGIVQRLDDLDNLIRYLVEIKSALS